VLNIVIGVLRFDVLNAVFLLYLSLFLCNNVSYRYLVDSCLLAMSWWLKKFSVFFQDPKYTRHVSNQEYRWTSRCV